MANIEILGIAQLQRAFSALPGEVRPMVCREIARKPANKAAVEARRLQPIGDTGATARTIGILKTKNSNQTYVEVGYRGRSLGHIYTSAERIVRRGRGIIRGFPNLFHRAGDNVSGSIKSEMKVDITKVLVRGMKKFGYG